MKQSGIFVWDCTACQSNGTDFIRQLQTISKTTFNSVVVVAQDAQALPASVNDVAISLPVKTRFGTNAIYDCIIDVISYLRDCQCACTVVVCDDNVGLWVSLFQRVIPRRAVFVSTRDPRGSLDFTFLPSSLAVTILGWPNLNAISETTGTPSDEQTNDDQDRSQDQDQDSFMGHVSSPSSRANMSGIPQRPRSDGGHQRKAATPEKLDSTGSFEGLESGHDNVFDVGIEELVGSGAEEEEEAFDGDTEDEQIDSAPSFNRSPKIPSASPGRRGASATSSGRMGTSGASGPESGNTTANLSGVAAIKPLSDLDKYQIDLRSPIGETPTRLGENPEFTPHRTAGATPTSRIAAATTTAIKVPAQFRVLVESMRSMGKTMISLGDLEAQLRTWSTKLGEPVDNTTSYINKATEAQIVIYDKEINYVRFRNRSLSTGSIEYV